MKKVLFSGTAMLLTMMAAAQMNQGTVIYNRTVKMGSINAGPGIPALPQSRTDKFELTFGDNKSLFRQSEKDNEEAETMSQGGMQVRMIVAGGDDVLFTDLTSHQSTELRVFFDKEFIVDHTITPMKWKIGEETKTILGHICRKATATTTFPRESVTINNGAMEKKQVQDTSVVTAWFAADIPVSAGPTYFQTQLPGLILALDMGNDRMVFEAVSLNDKADIASIKAPKGKKHYTEAEYTKERDDMLTHLQENNRGGNVQIKMN